MSFGNYVNLEEVEIDTYEALPEGEFPMIITSDETQFFINGEKVDESKSGLADRIVCVVDMLVIEGQYKDRTHREWFDIVNKNQDVRAKIGAQDIKKITLACLQNPVTTKTFHQLNNIAFIAVREKTKAKDGKIYINTKNYKPYTVGAATSSQGGSKTDKMGWL